MAARPPAVTVLFDRDCGFCRWCVGRVLAWDRRGAVRPVAIQSAEGERLLADLTRVRRLASVHAVDASGRRSSGGDALAPVAAALPGGAPLAALARRAPALARAAYGAVAGRRSLLGRLIGPRARARADARIAARGG
ncbi:MAG: DCC1-like thiol-disulfide oxidoreductase [Solirubrobacteraceae bacterium]|nr:DCC1-like thiol-disulfide oxidoreductase [Solirubrobacteraceae bacterium]